MKPLVIDTHCHLDFPDFSSELEQIIKRAEEAGVTRQITISTFISKMENLLSLTERFPHLYCSVGTHPANAAQEQGVSWQDIEAYTHNDKVVAIGECGLDYYYDQAPAKDVQVAVFLEHIRASQETQLPLIIHARAADKDMEDILLETTKQKSFPFVLHCYSSGEKLARTALDLGGYLSFSGIVTFKNALDIQHIAKVVPLDRLLVETDAPYLAPVPYRGNRNEPAFVINVAEKLAQLLELPFLTIAEQTTRNALRLFAKIR